MAVKEERKKERERSYAQNRNLTTPKWLKWGLEMGNESALQRSAAPPVDGPAFFFSFFLQKERITAADYLSPVIKAVLPNSIITRKEENRQEEMERGRRGEAIFLWL